MPSRLCIAVVAATIAGYCLPAAAQERDEMWEVTMKMEMPGMPMAMPPQTSRMCIAKGAKEEDYVPMRGECKTVESNRVGSKYTFKSVCNGKNQMTVTGAITYGDGTYDGSMQMTGMAEGQPMNMTQTYSGKRVGACTAATKAK